MKPMPHPEVHNHTRLACAILPLADEAGVPQLVSLLQGRFAIHGDGRARPLSDQGGVDLGGQPWINGAPEEWRLEPQVAFNKPGCDVVLNGHAVAVERGTTRMSVELAVGTLRQRAWVFGARRMLDGRRITSPEVFERVPLRFSEAFGGWDRRSADTTMHRVEPRNPLGRGFRDPQQPVDRDVAMPALENPDDLFVRYGQSPAPVGFGFVAPHWQPRAAYAGTYDGEWLRARMPLLPRDFDRRFFNSASPGLTSAQPLVGGESASVIGTTPKGQLHFMLPQLGTPLVHTHLRGRRRQTLKMRLDTLIIDTDAMELTMIWRAAVALRNGVHDLAAAEFHVPDPRARTALDEPAEPAQAPHPSWT